MKVLIAVDSRPFPISDLFEKLGYKIDFEYKYTIDEDEVGCKYWLKFINEDRYVIFYITEKKAVLDFTPAQVEVDLELIEAIKEQLELINTFNRGIKQ